MDNTTTPFIDPTDNTDSEVTEDIETLTLYSIDQKMETLNT
jgi:hypothetical protein